MEVTNDNGCSWVKDLIPHKAWLLLHIQKLQKKYLHLNIQSLKNLILNDKKKQTVLISP